MKKDLFTGWQHVFAFTFKHDTKGKYLNSTLIFAVIMFAIGAAISIIMAFVQKSSAGEISPIHTVHIINECKLEMLPLENFEKGDKYPDISFLIENKDAISLAEELTDSSNDIILKLSDTKDGFMMTAILPRDSEITEKIADSFLDDFSNVMEISKLIGSGISMDKLVYVLSGVNVTTLDAGEEEKSVGEEMVSMFLPMIIIFLLYFMVLIYGQSMGNAVSSEKTSKLIEMLLTMSKPYAMIFGKISAMTVAAIIQLFSWITSFIIGFIIGDLVAKTLVYPEYTNYIMVVFKVMNEQEASSAFSVGAFVLFAIVLCISILFFCLLAATFGSFATKTEEVPQLMAYYQLLVVLGFFGGYMVPMSENPMLTTLMRFIPITCAFLLPGDILVGNVSLLAGALYTLLLAAFTLGLVLLAGKVYFNQLFYKGENVIIRFVKKIKKSK